MSCQNEDKQAISFSFYHWKAEADFPASYQKAMQETSSKKIYMHFFDVVENDDEQGTPQALPNYVLRNVDPAYKSYEIIPVVYLTNGVLKRPDLNLKRLAKDCVKLIDQMSKHNFSKKHNSIQIDCDWTESTGPRFFAFIELLQEHFEQVDVTLRLHQIKYAHQTGVPPTQSGTLMLYNMGELTALDQNSILEPDIVSSYIDTKTSYPLPLKIALPLFSQMVVLNANNEIKIIKDVDGEGLQNTTYFNKISNTSYQVIRDTLFHGVFLNPTQKIKVESLDQKDIVSAYNIIKNSELSYDEVIFYHLDSDCLDNVELAQLISNIR